MPEKGTSATLSFRLKKEENVMLSSSLEIKDLAHADTSNVIKSKCNKYRFLNKNWGTTNGTESTSQRTQ